MNEEIETFDQMCERLAYYMMRDIARGTDAVRMAHGLAGSVLNWRRICDAHEKKKKTRPN